MQIQAEASPISVILEQATGGENRQVASFLGANFATDAELSVFVEGVGRERRLGDYLGAEAHSILDAGGAVDVARSERQIVAVAVWEQPGFRERASQFLRFGPAKLAAVRYRGLANWMRHRAQFLKLRPSVPHWHLVRLATEEAVRGRGLATALLEKRLEDIDRHGVPAHLESSSPESARLYGRLGFEPVGEIRLPSDIRILAMTRPPRNSAPPDN